MTRYVLITVFVLGMLTAFPANLAADTWYEHYAAAEKALSDGEWRLAVEEITTALEKRGDSGVRVRTYGMKFRSYFPYLKLGIAYYELGQLEAALQSFETEERLGAISGSGDDLRVLQSYRNLALHDQEEASTAEAARIAQIVSFSLSEARRLEDDGKLEDALGAVGNALAVAPEEEEALGLLARLREKSARRREEIDLAQRVTALTEQGRSHLAAGELSEAASVLRQALSLEESSGARALFEEAQTRLRDALASGQVEERDQRIGQAIEDAKILESSGRISEALDRLQSVLVLDPSNAEATALEERLLLSQAEADSDRRRKETIRTLLGETESALAAGDVRAAMAAANQVLSLDAGNGAALDHLARAYRLLNSQLLGQLPRQNVPPAISFVDSRQELDDGSLVELVDRAEFLLSGIVIDDSPVEITFSDGTGEPIEGILRSRSLGDLYFTEFQVERTLTVGPSILRTVANDSEGLSSASEYAVLYRRPFVRSPWFLVLLAAGPALALAAAIGQRARHRKRLRKRRFNPYTAGSPVLDQSLFFGRERLLDRILQTLHNNSLLLHGERRIGKTTLQHQLKRRLEELDDPDFEFYPVFVDLQGTPEERFFATLAEEIFEELGADLDDLEPQASLSGTYSYRDFVRDLREILKRLRQRTSKNVRLVLLIDEVDELNSYDPRINQKLRSLFMKSFAENLVAVVSGVSIKREWDREGSPWYNFFEEIDVGPFQPEDARQLVRQPVRGVIAIDEGAVERILEITECRPYRIQKLCMRLVNSMYESRANRITAADVEATASLSESTLP